MKTLLLPFAVATLLIAPAQRARACMALVQQQGGVAAQAAQVAVLSVHDDVTDIFFALDVPEANNPFGVLVPVPVEPTIDTVPVATDALAALEGSTRPTFFLGDEDDAGGGCACIGAPLSADGALKGGDANGGDPVDIGPVTAQWVTGTSGDAVADWLAAKGFVLPEGGSALLDAYATQGMSFIAFTRNDTSTGAARVGVHFTLDGDRRAYALRMSQLGGAKSMAFTLFVATPSDHAVGPDAPYEHLAVNELGEGGIIADGDYEKAVKDAVRLAGGKAFVVETFGPVADLPTEAQVFFPDDAFVTRLSTVASPGDLDVDVSFTDEPDISVQSFAGVALQPPGATPAPRPRLDLAISALWVCLLFARARPRFRLAPNTTAPSTP